MQKQTSLSFPVMSKAFERSTQKQLPLHLPEIFFPTFIVKERLSQVFISLKEMKQGIYFFERKSEKVFGKQKIF